MMENRNLLQAGVELYKCLMLTIVALLLLLILSEYRARTPGMRWTQLNPMPVKVFGEVTVTGERVTGAVPVTNEAGGSQILFGGHQNTKPLLVEVANWPSRY